MVILKERIFPEFIKFQEFSKDFNVIPVVKRVSGDLETPITLFAKLQNNSLTFLLESAENDGRWGRFSIIGRNPYMTFEVNDGRLIFRKKNKEKVFEGNPFSILESFLDKYNMPKYEGYPRYLCGITGYFGYDMIRYIENISFSNPDDIELPESFLIVPEEVIVYDHYKQQIYLIVNCFIEQNVKPEKLKEIYRQITGKLSSLENLLHMPFDNNIVADKRYESQEITIRSNITKESFMESVVKAKEYIKNGDIFQVVLSQRLETELNGSEFELYRKLRLLNPSPYMYFLRFDGFSIVGTSPEMLVRLTDNKLETCPIAGTRRRGKTETEDKMLERDLLSDEKELAEHTMLVDLGRNDIGRVSVYGTVYVKNFMDIQRFSHVMHIVSNVNGEKLKDKSATDVLKAVFPAGTVSGAPKIRAMEIIDELETTKRGIYSGAVGYLGFDGNMDTCITIRTAIIKGNKVFVQAGAGIVADSEPEKEYIETINKGKALVSVLGV